MGNVHQQFRHLGLVGQLPQHGTEGFLHLVQLLLVGGQVGSLAGLGFEGALELHFLLLHPLQSQDLVLHIEPVAQEQHHHDQDANEHGARGGRPVADIVEIEIIDVLELHCAASPSMAAWARTWAARRVNSATRRWFCSRV